MSPEKAVAEDEARAELDEDEPSSFLETGARAPDYGQAYLELLAKGGVLAFSSAALFTLLSKFPLIDTDGIFSSFGICFHGK